jgi:hypothetical protein
VKTLPKVEMQHRLFTEMMLLIDDDEVLNMLERLIENDDLLLDTAMMRRLRTQGRLNQSRDDILKIVDLRFQPPLSTRQQFEQQLALIMNETVLDMLLMTAVQCQTIVEFQTALDSTNKTH